MTRTEIRTYIQRALNDSSGTFLTTAMCNTLLAEAQELLAEHGPPVIRRVGIGIRKNWIHYRLGAFVSDCIMPVRIFCSANNTTLEPVTVAELDARNAAWETTSGNPTHWFPRGWGYFGIYPHPASSTGTLWVDYAAWPLAIDDDDAEPEFAQEDHEALALYGVYDGLLRRMQVEDALQVWQKFADGITRGAYTRQFGTPQAKRQQETP